MGKSKIETVQEAITYLHAQGRFATKEQISQVADLPYDSVSDAIKTLVEDGRIARVRAGVFEPVRKHVEPRAVSVTFPCGRARLYVADSEPIDLSMSEYRHLVCVLSGAMALHMSHATTRLRGVMPADDGPMREIAITMLPDGGMKLEVGDQAIDLRQIEYRNLVRLVGGVMAEASYQAAESAVLHAQATQCARISQAENRLLLLEARARGVAAQVRLPGLEECSDRELVARAQHKSSENGAVA